MLVYFRSSLVSFRTEKPKFNLGQKQYIWNELIQIVTKSSHVDIVLVAEVIEHYILGNRMKMKEKLHLRNIVVSWVVNRASSSTLTSFQLPRTELVHYRQEKLWQVEDVPPFVEKRMSNSPTCIVWSDSTITLWWPSQKPDWWKPFVRKSR